MGGAASSEPARRAVDEVVLRGVTKRFGGERALANVSLELRAGGVCALLGHNGAGKSTLIGILSTLAQPTSGTVEYRGGGAALEVGRGLRREIGLLAHASLCYAELSAVENLLLFAQLYDIALDAGQAEARLEEVGLVRSAHHRVARTYSRGMWQRLALARALLAQPSLVLLDEPFTGLDRGGALALGASLGALKQGGALVVVVTHDLEAIAELTDHVVVLRRGAVVHQDRQDGYTYAQLKDVYHRYAS
ncbi:MAG: ABC transporter ATP-binding protein [Kofleriaceae bacterium]